MDPKTSKDGTYTEALASMASPPTRLRSQDDSLTLTSGQYPGAIKFLINSIVRLARGRNCFVPESGPKQVKRIRNVIALSRSNIGVVYDSFSPGVFTLF